MLMSPTSITGWTASSLGMLEGYERIFDEDQYFPRRLIAVAQRRFIEWPCDRARHAACRSWGVGAANIGPELAVPIMVDFAMTTGTPQRVEPRWSRIT